MIKFTSAIYSYSMKVNHSLSKLATYLSTWVSICKGHLNRHNRKHSNVSCLLNKIVSCQSPLFCKLQGIYSESNFTLCLHTLSVFILSRASNLTSDAKACNIRGGNRLTSTHLQFNQEANCSSLFLLSRKIKERIIFT